jgi:hypothetical protein
MSTVRHLVVRTAEDGLMTVYPEANGQYRVFKNSLNAPQGVRMNLNTVRQLLKLVVQRGGKLEGVFNWP